MSKAIDIVLNKDNEFIEIEVDGHSVEVGQWYVMDDGTYIIRITAEDVQKAVEGSE